MQASRNKAIHVLITSAGTASAISVIKALKKQQEIPVTIFASDMDHLAAGLYLADHHFITPPAKDASYLPTLKQIIAEHHIEVLIPIYSKEISLIAAHASEFHALGVSTFLPEASVIDVCNDKIAIDELLKNSGIRLPRHFKNADEVSEKDFPVFFKPNFSSSSSGALAVANKEELLRAVKSSSHGIIQELIVGQEVTVDVFCNAASEALVVAPRLRLAVKSGQTIKGETIDAEPFRKIVAQICSLVKMKGVCNIQFFKTEKELVFIEINPRFAAGGLMLTVNAGANIPLLVLKSALGISIDEKECQAQAGFSMTRYWEEIILPPVNED